jgi:hypothetical protein
VNNPPDDKESDEHALGFAFQLSPLFVSVSLDFLCMAHAFFPKCLSNLCRIFFPRVVQHLMLFLCQIRCEITSGQITPNKMM